MCVCVCVSVCVVSDSLPTKLLCPWDPPGKNTGLPFPSSGDLPDPGTKRTSLSPTLAGEFFTTEPPGKPQGTDT